MEEGLASVVGSSYCTSETVHLVVPKPGKTVLVHNSDDDVVVFTASDTSSCKGLGRKKRFLLDSTGNIILTLRQKIISGHFRWSAFRGNSKDKEDLIFSARQSKIYRPDIKLKVFLANNLHKSIYDFKVGTSDGVIYVKDAQKNIMAEIRDCEVKVYPGVDQAFITSLIVIQDGIKQLRSVISEVGPKIAPILLKTLFGTKLPSVVPLIVLLRIAEECMWREYDPLGTHRQNKRHK